MFRIERRIVHRRTGEVREEVVYGVTSLSAKRATAAQLLGAVRCHWYIENRSHWVRDVPFAQDRSQARTGAIPQVMAALRNTAIGLLRTAGAANIAAACRRRAAQPWEALARLDAGQEGGAGEEEGCQESRWRGAHVGGFPAGAAGSG